MDADKRRFWSLILSSTCIGVHLRFPCLRKNESAITQPVAKLSKTCCKTIRLTPIFLGYRGEFCMQNSRSCCKTQCFAALSDWLLAVGSLAQSSLLNPRPSATRDTRPATRNYNNSHGNFSNDFWPLKLRGIEPQRHDGHDEVRAEQSSVRDMHRIWCFITNGDIIARQSQTSKDNAPFFFERHAPYGLIN